MHFNTCSRGPPPTGRDVGAVARVALDPEKLRIGRDRTAGAALPVPVPSHPGAPWRDGCAAVRSNGDRPLSSAVDDETAFVGDPPGQTPEESPPYQAGENASRKLNRRDNGCRKLFIVKKFTPEVQQQQEIISAAQGMG